MKVVLIIIMTVVTLIIIKDLIPFIAARIIKCPNCKSKGRSAEIDKTSLGANFRKGNKQLYRVYFECNKCYHKWSEIEEIEEHTGG